MTCNAPLGLQRDFTAISMTTPCCELPVAVRRKPISKSSQKGALYEVFQATKKRFKQWQTNRERRAAFNNLLGLDDKMLKDIGVTRDDVKWASQLPLSHNAALELEKLKHSGAAC